MSVGVQWTKYRAHKATMTVHVEVQFYREWFGLTVQTAWGWYTGHVQEDDTVRWSDEDGDMVSRGMCDYLDRLHKFQQAKNRPHELASHH